MIKNLLLIAIPMCLLFSCDTNKTKSNTTEIIEDQQIKEQTTGYLVDSLTARGFETFPYKDEQTGDTIVMQKYFIAFLNRGEQRDQSKEVADSLQTLHMAHLGKMYDLGFADISGPFGDDGDMRGITIYNVPTKDIADSLANSDPMVKAGRLSVIVKPWWAAKGFGLR